MEYRCDFHIHSCLSPCGDLSMSPSFIVDTLKQKGIQVAALTDHNTSLNCPAFGDCCKQNGIIPLYGMEAQTMEEVHILCLFSDLEIALKFSNEVYDSLPAIMNVPEKTGDQIYVDKDENILGEVEKYLITSIDLNIDELAAKVHALGGIVIPAHVDRAAFSLSSQLGFIPEGEWDALEVVRIPPAIETGFYPLIQSSDAHYPEHIARRSFILDTQEDILLDENGIVKLEVIKKALGRLL